MYNNYYVTSLRPKPKKKDFSKLMKNRPSSWWPTTRIWTHSRRNILETILPRDLTGHLKDPGRLHRSKS